MVSQINFSYLLVQWFLLVLFVIEAGVKIGVNFDHQFGIVKNHDLYEEISQDQRSTALATASLVFAALSIILSQNPTQFVPQIELLAVSFGFLLISAFAHEFTLTHRVVLTLQEMALEYGLLFMVYGLFRLISYLVPDARSVMGIVFIAVFVFRFASLKGGIRAHMNE